MSAKRGRKKKEFEGAFGLEHRWTIKCSYKAFLVDGSEGPYDNEFTAFDLVAEMKSEAIRLFRLKFEEFKEESLSKGRRIMSTAMPEVISYELHRDMR